MQARFHGTVADTQVGGNLVITPTFTVFEQQYFRVARGQPLQRLAHDLATFGQQQPVERIRRRLIAPRAPAGVRRTGW